VAHGADINIKNKEGKEVAMPNIQPHGRPCTVNMVNLWFIITSACSMSKGFGPYPQTLLSGVSGVRLLTVLPNSKKQVAGALTVP
jgi:hypothetical protein